MSASPRRQPKTLLDRLESQGYTDKGIAKVVRHLWPIILSGRWPEVEPAARHLILAKLVQMLMLPAKLSARAAAKDGFLMSLRHAYLVSVGNSTPTRITAKEFRVTQKTVRNNCKRWPIKIKPGRRRFGPRAEIQQYISQEGSKRH